MQQNTSKAWYWVGGVVVLVLVLFGLSKAFHSSSTAVEAPATSTPAVQGDSAIQTTYICDAGNTIGAQFSNDIATLTLSNGENLTLNQVDATSGAVFENQAGTATLTVLGPNATLMENGAQVFANCIEPKG